jgi:hypothetical protein
LAETAEGAEEVEFLAAFFLGMVLGGRSNLQGMG